MEDNKMITDTKLEMITYLQAVTDIALEYFNEDGGYQPHIGITNAMRIFYNLCVKESKYSEKYSDEIINISDLEEMVLDKEFIDAFNRAISDDDIAFSFGYAYRQAMDIVEYKKSSFVNFLDLIGNALEKLFDSFKNLVLDDDVIQKLTDIADKVSSGTINQDTIVDAYIHSDRFRQVVNPIEDSTAIPVIKESVINC